MLGNPILWNLDRADENLEAVKTLAEEKSLGIRFQNYIRDARQMLRLARKAALETQGAGDE